MRCRRPELLLVAALLAPGGAGAAATGLPQIADAIGDRARFAEFVGACAATLAETDRGLARVARACPGIDVVLADGPFAASLPRQWARRVDAAMLERLHDVARSFEASTPAAHALGRESLDAQLRELRAGTRRPVGLWERLAAWYEELTRREERRQDSGWLRDFLERLGLEDADNRWVETTIYALAVALVLALLVAEARAHGWWSRLRALASRREAPPAPGAVPGVAPQIDDPVAELAHRFGARLGELHAAGLVARPLTITCRELVGLASAQPVAGLASAQPAAGLAAVARVAPVVEAARYAAQRPTATEIDTALALLAPTTGGGRAAEVAPRATNGRSR